MPEVLAIVSEETLDAAAIEAAARRAGVLTWVGYNYRWAPLVQFARHLIADGKLGRRLDDRRRAGVAT